MGMDLEGQRLKDKVALITGAGGTNSIGRSVAIRFAREGAKVGVLDIDGPSATWVADEVIALGGEAIPLTCDITDLGQCKAAATKVADAWNGKIDILVNNAAAFRGVMSKQSWRPFNEWKVEEWDYMLDVNLRGMWFCAQAVFPYMKPQGYGKIINLTSSTFFEGVGGFIHYVSSKGGIIGFTRALGRELGEHGIRVNALAPGFTLTEANIEQTTNARLWWDVTRDRQSLKERNLQADDIAGTAFYLASADSDWVTCQTILVDGGLSMH